MDVTTRIEEENRVVPTELKHEILPTLSDVDSTDDELEGLNTFSMDAAKTDIYELQGCHKIMLKLKVQKQLGLEVGINVSQEFPWKRIKFSLLSQHLFDEIDNGEMLQEFFVNYNPDDKVLLGYAPSFMQQEQKKEGTTQVVDGDEDPFVIYVSEDDARSAAAIIKNIETYERFMMNKKLIKRPRKWISKGSEYEVNLGIPPQKSEVADVEIQTVYPMRQSRVKFEMRLTSDVRDGYAELIAGDARFQNVTQQRVNVGVQSAPATVTLEQQTDPTFPSNAWSQYLYEIKEEQDGLDESSEEEQEKGKSAATSKTVTPSTEAEKEPKPPPEMSEQIKYLLSVLEFNQIDMYRNDYPKISTAPIQIFTNPYLEEIFCFANISKSHQRYVSAVDWYPHLTGIVVSSYTFTTRVTQNKVQPKEKIDPVQRSILQPNPVLMWSFTDSLNFKLEFEAPREITALSFCPYDKNILIGGTINGQIIIWDLQDRTKNLEAEEHLTIQEASNREHISEFLAWTIQYDEGSWVFPAAVSALDGSQTDAVTEIKWLSRNHYISSNGRIHENYLKTKSRYFSTLSLDGSVAYWNLDYDMGNIAKAASSKRQLPLALTQNESVYKKLDKCIKPIFVATYSEALTSIVCDVANFTYTPQIVDSHPTNFEGKTFLIDVTEADDQSAVRNTFIVGSFFGRIDCLTFEGNEPGSEINKENITSPTYSFARVHDGPIVALKKNPYYPEIFVSIGRHVMAIWREDFHFTPILWRVRPKILTAVEWSTDRPAVLYLTRSDGSFEAWDLLARDDDACLVEVLGGGIITALSEHRSAIPKKVISIGDYDSSFRMVALPESFYKPVPNELEQLQNFVEKEVSRKKAIQSWQQNWCTQNADIIEEKKKMKAAAAKDLERLRLEAEDAKKLAQTPEDKKEQTITKSATHYDFEEKLDKKWDELNLKRLIRNLMARKMVDPEKLDRETALEKERLRYEERKKASINEAISKVSEEIAVIRARLLPIEKEDIQLSDTIAASLKNIFEIAPSYADVESEAKTFLDETPPIPVISYDTIMARCRERRQLLNKVLGVPFDRTYHCEQEQKSGGFKEWNHGYDEFIRTLEEEKRKNTKPSDSSLPQASYSDLDLIPQRDLEVL
ncbi:dynein axonemal intermediate chain 3 [Episyrphus balteatus]|uniref:dynein axonemal intermediate chain 3 n=1 Tax=Episyrphus balteatus TaxID=286459 RepID=UPI0024865976|nr:dynein axonemal intermediate chain 3 [Episyrphus balteatus]